MNIDIEEVVEMLVSLYDNTARGHENESRLLVASITKALEQQQAEIKKLREDLKFICTEAQISYKHARNTNALAREIMNFLSNPPEQKEQSE